jgi:hypothetical protein
MPDVAEGGLNPERPYFVQHTNQPGGRWTEHPTIC